MRNRKSVVFPAGSQSGNHAPFQTAFFFRGHTISNEASFVYSNVTVFALRVAGALQGYLAHKKQPPPP